jgi:AraC family transcriptional regulator
MVREAKTFMGHSPCAPNKALSLVVAVTRCKLDMCRGKSSKFRSVVFKANEILPRHFRSVPNIRKTKSSTVVAAGGCCPTSVLPMEIHKTDSSLCFEDRKEMQAAAGRLVHTETNWQTPPARAAGPGERLARIGLARWAQKVTDVPFEMSADEASDAHFITYSVKQADVRFSIGHRAVTDGVVNTGRVLLQGPTSARRQSIYHESFDFFRVYFSQEILAECVEAIFGKRPASTIALFGAHFVEDRILNNLSRVLLSVDEDGGLLGPSFVDSVGIAVTSHLVGLYSSRPLQTETRVKPLPVRKLRRVRDFVEENLSRPIYLAELSELAELSRMHFAAQFRAATGRSAHAYILQRKIARAQSLLSDAALSVSDIALIVGFRNNSHFATAFRKIAGQTPSQWRNSLIL